MKKMFFVVSRENLKALKDHTFSKKNIRSIIAVRSIICSKCENRVEKRFKAEQSIEILKILGLT